MFLNTVVGGNRTGTDINAITECGVSQIRQMGDIRFGTQRGIFQFQNSPHGQIPPQRAKWA